MDNKQGTGIIVGRFQVLELTPVHERLIAVVQERHKRVIVFLGSNPAPSLYNPIDLELRQLMFNDRYGDDIVVEEMPDLPDDRIWSQELDRRILELRPEETVTLYGSEEDFVLRYSGRYHTEVLEPSEEEMKHTPQVEMGELRDFRAGMIYAHLRRFPTVYPTVDVAVFRNDGRELLLARKENETRYRFPGGFTDPSDGSYEEAALRELVEECGVMDIESLVYIGSCRIDDWRYRNSWDVVMTHLYACVFVEGDPQPNDDISELRWFELNKLSERSFVPEHQPLWEMLKAFLEESEKEI
ncbi:MAG: NUDIX domain-containing protein [Saprospiraceae bacterium]|nr:NUDIX domain-containing protein [Saprospiraceae bacterium]